MSTPIALQLYTLRDELLARGLEDTLGRVADLGYVGVQPFDLDLHGAERTRAVCDALGLQVASLHAPLASGDDRRAVVDTVLALGTPSVVSSSVPSDVASTGSLARFCDRVEEARAALADHGVSVGLHNHWWELEPVDGVLPFDVLRGRLPDDVFFEVDVYWAETAGVDAAALVADLGPRAPLLHLKDGPARQGEPMVAVGDGSIDIPQVVAAGDGHTRWLIVELDECATDMFTVVARSIDYLRSAGLGAGR